MEISVFLDCICHGIPGTEEDPPCLQLAACGQLGFDDSFQEFSLSQFSRPVLYSDIYVRPREV
jgi:hypothetical protein